MKEYQRYVGSLKRMQNDEKVDSTKASAYLCFYSSSQTLFQKRLAMQNQSHMTETMQTTRLALENGDISAQEKEDAIRVRISRCLELVAAETFQEYLSNTLFVCRAFLGLSLLSNTIRMHGRWSRLCLVETMGMDQRRRRCLERSNGIASTLDGGRISALNKIRKLLEEES
jgi:hypothetical protein